MYWKKATKFTSCPGLPAGPGGPVGPTSPWRDEEKQKLLEEAWKESITFLLEDIQNNKVAH